MYYLNEFLRKGAAHPSFPEQQPKCGKFKALYKLLQEYYHLWKRDNDELSTMLKRSSEDLLIKYVENFTSHYNQNYSPNNQADAENPFQIIEDLIPKPEVSTPDIEVKNLTPLCHKQRGMSLLVLTSLCMLFDTAINTVKILIISI